MRAAVAGLLLVLVAGLAVFVPAASTEHVVFSSTPNSPPLFALTALELGPASTACTRGIVLGADAELLRLTVAAPGGPDAVPLTLRLTAPGYAATSTVRDYSAPGERVEIAILRAPRTLPAILCFTNAGTRALSLGATTESRTASRTTTTVDGKPTPADPTIQLLRREPRSFAALLPTLFERAATFKPGFAGPWLFWALAALLVIGLPLGAAVALAVEPRKRDAEAAELEQDEPAQHDRRVSPPQAAGQGEPGDRDANGDH